MPHLSTAEDHGFLDVGDGHVLAWEIVGAVDDPPLVVLHGGPGSGTSERTRRLCEAGPFRAVLFDQRNAGRSRPFAGEADVDLTTNTTAHLVADIERLREHLGIETWAVYGNSWGSTLALVYALAHPTRVRGIVLSAVALTSRAEIDWITRGVGLCFPEAYERFSAHLSVDERTQPAASYHRRLMHADADVRAAAAKAWCDWEQAIVAVVPGQKPDNRFADPRFRLGFARLVTHYWSNAAWLREGELLERAPELAGIPAILVHGRLDLASPMKHAWDLAHAWPGCRLTVVETAGHDGRDPGLGEAVATALQTLHADLTTAA